MCNSVKHMVEELRKINDENERVQSNISAAIVYLDLALHEAAQQSAQRTATYECENCQDDPETDVCVSCGRQRRR